MRGDRTPHSHFTWLLTRPSSRSRPLGETGPGPRAASLALPGHSLYIRLPGRRNRVAVRSSRHSNVMLNEVYNSRILELAGNIPRLGRLANPDASATAHSKLCGSTVTVDLKMEGDTVTDFSHEVKACALGQASSSIMARNVIGAKADELRGLRETVRRMLKENGTPPAGKWADIAVLEPVRDYKARHASTLLTFDAVTNAIDQIEAKRRAAMAAE
jgi:NifU-like protein involved in Fe-S cluster formation